MSAALARSTVLGANNGATVGTTTLSITNFTISGTEKVLYCWVGSSEQTVTSPDPTVVWDSAGVNEGLTRIGVTTGTGEISFLYRKIAPTDGVNKTISFSGLSATSREAAYCALYTGVDQVTPNDTIDLVELASSQNPSSGSITSPAGDWILSFFHRAGSIVPTATGGGNVVVGTQASSSSTSIYGLGEDTDGADDTFDWASGGLARWSIMTFNLNASGGAPAATCQGKLSLLGVGCHP